MMHSYIDYIKSSSTNMVGSGLLQFGEGIFPVALRAEFRSLPRPRLKAGPS